MAGSVLVALAAGALTGTVAAALPTAAYRLSVDWGIPPRTGCPACGRPDPAGLAGWFRLGRRCAGCGARNGPPTWAMAGLAAVTGAGLGWRFGPTWTLLPFLALVPLGCLLGAIDLACHRLPSQLVLPGLAAALIAFAGLAARTGDWSAWLTALLAGLAMGAGYLILVVLSAGQLGGGDVTLAALLGVFLGWLGWRYVLVGALLPFAVHAPVAGFLLVTGRAGARTELPFGPAMLIGGYLAVLAPTLLERALSR